MSNIIQNNQEETFFHPASDHFHLPNQKGNKFVKCALFNALHQRSGSSYIFFKIPLPDRVVPHVAVIVVVEILSIACWLLVDVVVVVVGGTDVKKIEPFSLFGGRCWFPGRIIGAELKCQHMLFTPCDSRWQMKGHITRNVCPGTGWKWIEKCVEWKKARAFCSIGIGVYMVGTGTDWGKPVCHHHRGYFYWEK